MNDCLLLPMFPWTPIVQTRAANWLTRFKWKEILSTLCRECIMKNFRAVLEKSNIEVSLLMHVLGYILPWTTIFCFGYFIMFKQLFVLHFHKDTFNFVPPMFYVGIWRSLFHLIAISKRYTVSISSLHYSCNDVNGNIYHRSLFHAN